MADKFEPVAMRRFWFCVYDEAPLFHAAPDCEHLKRSVTRDRRNLSVAHIPVDSNDIGAKSNLNFCSTCGSDTPFSEDA